MKVSSVIFATAALLASATAADHSPNVRQLTRGGGNGERGQHGRGHRGRGKRDDSDDYMYDSSSDDESCEDPVGAVLDLFDCLAVRDAECAAAAYDPDSDFQRFHNEVLQEIAAGGRSAWHRRLDFSCV